MENARWPCWVRPTGMVMRSDICVAPIPALVVRMSHDHPDNQRIAVADGERGSGCIGVDPGPVPPVGLEPTLGGFYVRCLCQLGYRGVGITLAFTTVHHR